MPALCVRGGSRCCSHDPIIGRAPRRPAPSCAPGPHAIVSACALSLDPPRALFVSARASRRGRAVSKSAYPRFSVSTESKNALRASPARVLVAPLAQLDRASGYEPGGRRFESCRAHHPPPLASTTQARAMARCVWGCLWFAVALAERRRAGRTKFAHVQSHGMGGTHLECSRSS